MAVVLGRTLGFYKDEISWFKIRRRVGFEDNNVSVLKVGFDLLPSYLKPCFAFCSVFPKGISIRKEELVQLWMCEGFVESSDEGNKYFDALLANSFFQDAEMDENGEVVQCKMHDLVHDLALYLCLSKHETSLIHRLHADDQFISTLLHTLVDGTEMLRTVILNGATYNREIWESKRLRAVQFIGADSDLEVFLSSISKLNGLRYLNLSNSDIKELPESTAILYNLQFLDLSNSKIKKLSESFANLYNLQSLNLSYSKIEELPEVITKLYNLRTLNISNSIIKELPQFISELKNLQTLNVSNSNIKQLPASISNLSKLQILDVSYSSINKLPVSIGKLHSLQTLNVSNSMIRTLPKSIINLYNLQTLKFVNCKKLVKLPRKKLRNLVNLKHIAFSYEHQMPYEMGKLTGLETLPLFVVGTNRGGSIRELERLSKLKGNLEITRLEEVVDEKDADRANLQEKADLRGLSFQWSYGEENRISSDEELLEGLRPNTNIKRIKIKYYMSEKWPSWMLRMKSQRHIDSVLMLNNLVDLSLERCWNCVQLPSLGDLASLQFLHISHMKRLKCIGNEFYGVDRKDNLRLFPALKSLSLSWMENLTEWTSPSDGNRIIVFPFLESLSIQSCAKLTGFPVSVLSAVAKLEIKNCEEFRFIYEQQSFPFITSLSIVGCSKLTYLRNRLPPDTCVREFNIRRCEWLTFIPEDLGKLSSLTSLEMYCCKRLRCFPEEILSSLTQLRNLSVGAFSEELDDFRYLNRITDMSCLEELEIWGSDFFGREMYSLPNQLQHFTVLKSLKIMGFTTMEALPEWLTNLQSLQSLSLDHCRHLNCQSAATIIPRLSNITHLYVYCCPLLEEKKLKKFLFSNGTEIKVEFSHVSKVRVRLGY